MPSRIILTFITRTYLPLHSCTHHGKRERSATLIVAWMYNKRRAARRLKLNRCKRAFCICAFHVNVCVSVCVHVQSYHTKPTGGANPLEHRVCVYVFDLRSSADVIPHPPGFSADSPSRFSSLLPRKRWTKAARGTDATHQRSCHR